MTLTALVTGVGGQDGVLLSRLLAGQGHAVIGTVQPGAEVTLAPYLRGVEVVEHDVRDTAGFARLLTARRPDRIYNLAAMSSVGQSEDNAEESADVNGEAVVRMLEAVVAHRDRTGHAPRFFQASSAEVFDPALGGALGEATPTAPRSAYGRAKLRAQLATVEARESGGLHAGVGILFNHEGPLRGPQFVTRKITRAVAEIAEGRRETLTLGALDASRDWSSADDVVAGIAAAVDHAEPRDYVFASGRAETVRTVVRLAFEAAGICDGLSRVRTDAAFVRPDERPVRCGDTSRARDVLGWQATTPLAAVIAQMVRVDRERLRSGVEEDESYLERGSRAVS